MNKEDYEKFLRLSNMESRQFFILYIGLDCFLKGYDVEKMDKQSFRRFYMEHTKSSDIETETIIEEPFSYRLKIYENNTISYILYRNKDRTFAKVYLNKEKGNSIRFQPMLEYLDVLPDRIVGLLIDVSHNNVKKGEGYKELSALKELKKPNEFYRFVVGAGINYGYGLPLWDDIKADFENAVDSLLAPKASEFINKEVFNTNYGSFQILKDISYHEYHDLLTKMVSYTTMPKRIDESTLTAISAVIYAQYMKSNRKQTILTFNYDELLESTIENSFGVSVETVYKHSKMIRMPKRYPS